MCVQLCIACINGVSPNYQPKPSGLFMEQLMIWESPFMDRLDKLLFVGHWSVRKFRSPASYPYHRWLYTRTSKLLSILMNHRNSFNPPCFDKLTII